MSAYKSNIDSTGVFRTLKFGYLLAVSMYRWIIPNLHDDDIDKNTCVYKLTGKEPEWQLVE